MSHSGSKPRQQTSMTQGYKSLSHGMTNVSIPEVNMLKNSSTFAASVSINFSFNLVLFRCTAPGKLTLWTYYLLINIEKCSDDLQKRRIAPRKDYTLEMKWLNSNMKNSLKHVHHVYKRQNGSEL